MSFGGVEGNRFAVPKKEIDIYVEQTGRTGRRAVSQSGSQSTVTVGRRTDNTVLKKGEEEERATQIQKHEMPRTGEDSSSLSLIYVTKL